MRPPPPLPGACRAARRQWLCPRGGRRRHRGVVQGELRSGVVRYAESQHPLGIRPAGNGEA
jgi:hypothetical protein